MRDKARNFVVAVVALMAAVWTLAAVVTLVYWSGLALWMCAAAAAVGFVWTLRVYLRPTELVEVVETNRSSASR